MAEVSSHAPGSFSWAELATTDQTAGVAFYRALFDWGVDETPVGPGETYSMFQLRGRAVGAAYSMREDERQMGVPAHWNMYVTVVSVEESTKRAQALGGTVVAPPFDVMDAGRMAVLQDPTGAIFQVWEPTKHIGAEIVNEPGALCWTELASRDTKAAKAFYTSLFGWKATDSSADAPMEYTEFSVGDRPSSGMMPMRKHVPPTVPSFWMPYFQVADCDASFSKAKQLGADAVVSPQGIPKIGRFAMLKDRQGALFAIFMPAPA